jgi:hypothetical protein
MECNCEINQICVKCADVYEFKINTPDHLEKVREEAERRFNDSLFNEADNEAVRSVFIQGAEFYKSLIE